MSQWIITNRNRVKKAFSLLMFPTDVWNTNIKVINVTKLMQMIFNTWFGHCKYVGSLSSDVTSYPCCVVSDSLQPRGLKPTRLLCPWDFPGKNTGVGCRVLLQGSFPAQGLNCVCCVPALAGGFLPLHCLGSPRIKLTVLSVCLDLIIVNSTGRRPPEADPEAHLQPEIPSAPSKSSAGHSTFSIHCINLILRFSCIFTFLEIIKHNMPKM